MELTPGLPAVQHRPERGRFELSIDGQLCVLEYRIEGTTLVASHTGVPAELRGRGLAARLAAALVEHCRSHQLRLRPECSYVAAYLARQPAGSGVVDAD